MKKSYFIIWLSFFTIIVLTHNYFYINQLRVYFLWGVRIIESFIFDLTDENFWKPLLFCGII